MRRNTTHAFEFGPYRLDVEERSLWLSGCEVHLTGRAFDILLLLVRKSGRVVGKDEIMREVWPDSFVEESNITVNISALRKALSADGEGRKYIETLSGRGYRFVAGVQRLSGALSRPVSLRESPSASRSREQNTQWLAVLPLANASGDEELEYLCDGITENLINTLSKLSFLRVMARNTVFHYKGAPGTAQALGRRLNVDRVIVGQVLRQGKQLTVSVEMVNVSDGSQVWGERYSFVKEEVFAVHETIASDAVERLRLRLTAEQRDRLAVRYTGNTAAYECYLKGRYFWNKYSLADLNKAIEYFRKAVELDPNYALAYCGISDSYFRLSSLSLAPESALPLAKDAALRAVELDDLLSEAHSSLGVIRLFWNHDFDGAEREYLRAIELDPRSPIALLRRATCLMYTAQFDAAFNEMKRALEFDPLSSQIRVAMAACLIFRGDYGEAISQANEIVELTPNHYPARVALGYAHMHCGNMEEAIMELRRSFEMGRDYHSIGLLGCVYANAGRRKEAESYIEELREASATCYVSPYHIATIYSCLGEHEDAFVWLERLYNDRNDYLVLLKISPELRRLHADQRFTRLLRLVGFIRS